MGIKPLHDRVVIRRLDAETTTKGGLIIPDSAAEKPSQGEIVAVGDGAVLKNGETRPMSVKVGDWPADKKQGTSPAVTDWD